MAAILQLRRGTNSQTGSIHFEESELFYNQSKETLQIGYSSSLDGNLITLTKLNSVNTGSLNISGDITASNAYFRGDVRLDGQIFLGDVATDNINVNAQFSGSLIPSQSNTFDLGSISNPWRTIYSTTINGSITDTHILAFTASQESKNSTLGTYTGSIDSKFTTLGNYTSSIDSKFTTLGTYTGSVDLDLQSIHSYTASNDVKWDTLSDVTASLINATGSYATTGSNKFDGDQTITGSLVTSGSKVEFNVQYPQPGNEQHIVKTNGFTLDDRTYGYSAIALEHYEFDPGTYHNALMMYMFSENGTYGTELSVSPYDTHLRTYPSGANAFSHYANIATKDALDGTSQALIEADKVIIGGGTYTGSVIIGNIDSGLNIYSHITASQQITAPLFSGSLYGISNTLQFSQSVDSRASNLELFSASADNRLNNLQLFSSSQEAKDSTLASYTGSIDTKFDTIGAYTTSIDADLSNIRLYTASLKTALEVDGQDLTVYGNLTVQGTQTSLNTTEVYVEDKTLTLASGSTNSAEAEGSGIIIAGADKSILWDNLNQSFNVNSKVSSSVGFKGDGSELTGVHAADVEFENVLNKPTLISGSSQVTQSLDLRYLEINGDSVVTGSSQIDLTLTTNYVSGIKTRLDSEGVISGSTQITNGSGLLSSSIDTYNGFSSSVDLRLTTAELFKSVQNNKNTTLATYTASIDSSLANINETTSSLNSFSSSINDTIKTKLNVETVVSGSSQVTASLDLRYEGIASETHTLVSGSSQVTASLDLRYEVSGSVATLVGAGIENGPLGSAAWYHVSNSIADGNPNTLGNAFAIKDYVDQAMILAGAGDITAVNSGDGLSGGAQSGSVTLTLSTGSIHFTDGVKSKLNTEGVFSGSTQLINLGFPTTSSSDILTNKTIPAFNITSDGLSRVGTYGNAVELFAKSSILLNPANAREVYIGVYDNNNKVVITSDLTSYETTGRGIISGSSQIFGGSGLLSSSNETFNTFSTSIDSRLDIAESFSSSINTTIKTKLDVEGVVSGSSQIVTILGPLNTFTASQESKDSTLATYTGSNDTKWNTIGSQSGSWVTESETGSFARTNVSNTFTESQTISGSLYITQDLIVQGSSSIQNISSSQLNIGTNIVQMATSLPSVRYAGWSVVDSGSSGVSASMLWDSQTDEFIFTHKSAGSEILDSSMFIYGPLNTGSLDNIVGIIPNRLTKGESTNDHNHHITASQISDDGTTVSIPGNLQVTGSITGQILATNGIVSGSAQISGLSITNNTITIAGTSTALGGTISLATITNGSGIVSGSTQITKTLQNVTTAGATTSDAITITNATASTDKTTGALIVTGGIGVGGGINAGGDIVAYASSDRRLKDNIQPIQNPIEKINQIGGYSFDWNEEIQDTYKGKDYGVIAQEIEEVFPELVQTRDNGYKAVKYDKLVSVLIEGIKHLSKEVEDLKSQLNK